MRAPRTGLVGGRNKSYTLAEKLASRTIPHPNGCLEVQGWANHKGYVRIQSGSLAAGNRERKFAHVIAWETANGRPVPRGLEIMHACDNPRCVNPAHLSVGTHQENHLDSVRKGRKNAFGRQKLNADQVREIRALRAAGWLCKDIGRKFGIKRQSVSTICNWQSWRHLDRPFDVANVEPVPFVHLTIRGEVA